MVCPSCQGRMVGESYGGIQIDVCETCEGVWFDEGELGKFLHLNPTTQSQYSEKHPDSAEDVGHWLRVCPNCHRNLESFRYAYSSPIVIDSCPGCNGIFVGPGELEQIEEFRAQAARPDARSDLAVATAELDAGIARNRQRAMWLAQMVRFRRLSVGRGWWMFYI